MDFDECDMYELKKKSDICHHFMGDKSNEDHITECWHHCSFYDSISLMKNGEPLIRKHGAFTQKRGR